MVRAHNIHSSIYYIPSQPLLTTISSPPLSLCMCLLTMNKIDVREPHELLDTGKIPGAINIPITSAVQSFHISDEDFEDLYGYARPPKDAALLFYCKAGVRARAAAGLAQHAGWASVGEYPGSWLDWDLNKGPVEAVKPGGSKGEGK